MNVSINAATFEFSVNQKECWTIQASGAHFYNQVLIAIDGRLYRDKLLRCIDLVLERHEALSARCIKTSDSAFPHQLLRSETVVDFFDFHAGDEDYTDTIKRANDALDFPYDPFMDGPLRICLVEMPNHHFILLVRLYALWSDAWTAYLFYQELCSLYLHGEQTFYTKEIIEHRNFSKWQNDLVNNPEAEAVEFWKAYNCTIRDRIIPFERTGNQKFVPLQFEVAAISGEKYQAYKKTCRDLNTELPDLLLGIYCLYIGHFTENEFTIGFTPFARPYKELEGTAGSVATTLPVTINPSVSKTISQVVDHIAKQKEELLSWADYFSMDYITDARGNRSFPYCYEYVDISAQRPGLSNGIAFCIDDMYSVTRPFVVKLLCVNYGDRLELKLLFDKNKFKASDIPLWISQFRGRFAKVDIDNIDNPAINIDEKHLVDDVNRTAALFNTQRSVLSLFEEQATKNPGNIAIVCGAKQLSYLELKEQSSHLAGFLIEQCAIEPGDRIAIILDRSVELVIALLGVMKAGATYIPIDPAYPAERIEYILNDSSAKLVIAAESRAKMPAVRSITIADTEKYFYSGSPGGRVADIAYIIYTSGSTGNPKGCMITHQNLSNYLQWASQFYFDDDEGNCGLITSVAFDLTVSCLFVPLIRGKKIIIPAGHKEISELLEESFNHPGIDTLKLTPSHISLLKDADIRNTNVRVLICGGEQLSFEQVGIVRKISKAIRIYNEYGPTETTVGSVVKQINEDDDKILIGKPIANTEIFILNEKNNYCPVGVTGEIFIGGAGVGAGYWNKPALTAEKFITNLVKPEERVYRTGDMARWLPDGNIEYLGRNDEQVKIHGYRIEPGEIESVLQTYPGISSAAVLAKKTSSGDWQLAAYITGAIAIDKSTISAYLQKSLPAYMVPAHFIQLDKLPITANGKIDRQKLLSIEEETSAPYLAPGNEVETKLAAIWQNIFNKERIGVNDHFFDLGGHSLKLTQLSARINKELGVWIALRELFATPVLKDQAALVSSRSSTGFAGIARVSGENGYLLSSSQRRLWILSQFSEGNIAYNMPGSYLFQGALSLEALRAAFTELVMRHEILRTVFRENDKGEVRQFVTEGTASFNIGYEDLRGRSEELKQFLEQDYTKALDLSTGPLLRATLYQISDDQWILSCLMHHIISDGWSMRILIKELLENYNHYKKGLPANREALRIQYKDYAGWQQQQLQSGALAQHKEYWLQQFAGELPVTELPTDRPRPLVKTYNGGAVTRTFDLEVGDSLKELCRRQDCTLFMGLLAMVNLLLHRYTGQEDIIIGSPVAGREHADLEDQIGFYVNTLALRTRFDTNDSFIQLLQKNREVTLSAYEHQSYPFDELVDTLSLRRDPARNPLFDVSVVLQNISGMDERLTDEDQQLQISRYEEDGHVISKFDLLFVFIETESGLQVQLEYNSDLYDRSSAERMLAHLEVLMGSVKTGFAKAIGELEYITGEEKQTILTVFNKPFERCGEEQTIMRLFEAQVKLSPTKDALVCNEGRYSYEALNERAERLGYYLQQSCGISRGDRVAIMTENSLQLITAILATLKAGGAYVPIDPDYPAARRSFILDDTQSRVLITQKKYLDDYSRIVITEEDEQKWITASAKCTAPGTVSTDLAYIMYTSGSTGKPKGVMIEQRGVVRLVKDCNYVQLSGEEVLLSTGSVSFDATTFEYWAMLLNGGRLVMSSRSALLDEEQLRSIITGNGVNMMWFTAGWLNQLVDKDPELFAGLKTIIAGGDKLSPAHIKKLRARYPGLRIINGYGPTENTTFSLTYAIDSVDEEEEIPIGKPIGRSEAYILDEQKKLCGIGVIGEICVGGEGLARGYLHNESLTKERFIKNPFKEGELLYRTGDLGRWTAQGDILFRGRKDDQVKIRGYRVEPAETAQCLENHEQIESAAVQVRTSSTGEKELIAYIVSKAALDSAAIRQYLSGQLPAYMIPDYYIMLDELPLTGNGKVDKSRLPDPEGRLLSSGREYKAPQNDTEQKLVEIWQEILQREQIGTRDDFFESGGNSLKALQLITRIRTAFQVRINIQNVFQEATIENLSRQIIFFQDQNAWKLSKENLVEIEI